MALKVPVSKYQSAPRAHRRHSPFKIVAYVLVVFALTGLFVWLLDQGSVFWDVSYSDPLFIPRETFKDNDQVEKDSYLTGKAVILEPRLNQDSYCASLPWYFLSRDRRARTLDEVASVIFVTELLSSGHSVSSYQQDGSTTETHTIDPSKVGNFLRFSYTIMDARTRQVTGGGFAQSSFELASEVNALPILESVHPASTGATDEGPGRQR